MTSRRPPTVDEFKAARRVFEWLTYEYLKAGCDDWLAVTEGKRQLTIACSELHATNLEDERELCPHGKDYDDCPDCRH